MSSSSDLSDSDPEYKKIKLSRNEQTVYNQLNKIFASMPHFLRTHPRTLKKMDLYKKLGDIIVACQNVMTILNDDDTNIVLGDNYGREVSAYLTELRENLPRIISAIGPISLGDNKKILEYKYIQCRAVDKERHEEGYTLWLIESQEFCSYCGKSGTYLCDEC